MAVCLIFGQFPPRKLKALPVKLASSSNSDDSDFEPATEKRLPRLSHSSTPSKKDDHNVMASLDNPAFLQDIASADSPEEHLVLPPSLHEPLEDANQGLDTMDYGYISHILKESPPPSDSHEGSP